MLQACHAELLLVGGIPQLGRPTSAFSGVAGDLHRPARALARHHAPRSRPAQGPRQRRPLQSVVGPSALQRDTNTPSQNEFFFYLLVHLLHLGWFLGFLMVFLLSLCKTFTPTLVSWLPDGFFVIFV